MLNARTVLHAWAACLAAATASAQGGPDVKVNGDSPGTVQNETVVTVDFANNSRIVVAFNDRVGSATPTPIGVSTSQDGGRTWFDQQLGVPADPFVINGSLGAIFDPFAAWGPPAEFYAGYVATLNATSPQSGIFIERSDDGGLTWSGPTTIALDGPAAGPVDPNYRFNDRPHIDVGPAAFVCVTWIKDVGVNQSTSDVYFSFSHPPVGPINQPPFPPTNLSFSPQTVVNDMPNGVDMANAPGVATHPTGLTYVAWIDVNVLLSDPSTGTIKLDSTLLPMVNPVFGPDITVATIDPLPRQLSSTLGVWDEARAGSYPAIALDEGDGTGLTIYMAYAADPVGADEGDIFFIKSLNGGATWSSPIRVNDDVGTNDQMHPVIVQNGSSPIWIAWYDKRNSPTDSAFDVYFAASTNGGTSFGPNVALTDATFATPTSTAGMPWVGEYLGLDTDGADAYLAFTKSTADSLGDAYFDRLSGCAVPFLTYCTAGTSAAGCNAQLSASGIPSATATSGFVLNATGAEGAKTGIYFYAQNGMQASPWGSSTSYQCVVTPVRRGGLLTASGTAGACDGTFTQDLNARWCASCPRPLHAPVAGTSMQLQLWYRDPMNTSNQTTSLSDAIEVVPCP